jgi:hypothetical protein
MVTEMQKLRNPGPNKIGQDVTLRSAHGEGIQNARRRAARPGAFVRGARDRRKPDDRERNYGGRGFSFLMAEIVRQGVRRGMGMAQREQLAAMKKRALASFGPVTTEAAGGQRFVSPEVFMDPVNRGAVQGTFYPDLIIREIPVAQPQAIVPRIDMSDAALVDSGEAATIEEGIDHLRDQDRFDQEKGQGDKDHR